MLIFNGVDLEEYIIIDDSPDIEELAERKNDSISIPCRHGEIYTGYKYGTKKITIEFYIDAKTTENYINTVRTLKSILNTEDTSKLYLPDELDKYYYAVIESFECREKYQGVGYGKMVFICHDPFAYSEELKVFEGDTEKIVTVINNGTTKTYPLINIAFANDCHFAQVTNWDGQAVLVGNRPSAENSSKAPSNMILKDNCESTANWLPAGDVVDADRVVDGSVTISENGDYITGGSYGAAVEGVGWHGAAVRRNLNDNITDFEVKARMVYKDKYGATDSKPSGNPTGTTTGNYKTTPTALNFRAGAGTSYKVLATIPKGTVLNITDFNSKKTWGKCVYKSKTGWVSMAYLTKTSSNKALKFRNHKMIRSENNDKEENKMGRCELYGFDKNGQKLFKILVRDSEYYYQYTQPEAFIGSTIVLEDKKTCPKPKTKTEKKDGKTETKKIESGKFGDFNNFYGEFLIRRETKKGKQYWTFQIDKIDGGKVKKTLKVSNLVNSKYPTGDLNHVVLWFGQHKTMPLPEEIGLTDLKISRLNKVAEDETVINFSAGDELEIDCSENRVRLNGFDYMEKIDIGSQFFGCDTGLTQFICNTDDEEAYVSAVIQEKWL